MKSVVQYRLFAEHYRKLADKLGRPNDKQALELMARAWDNIAMAREERLIGEIVRELLDRVRQQQDVKPVTKAVERNRT